MASQTCNYAYCFFSRLRNTIRQVSIPTRVVILTEFVVKLRSSGYSKSTVSGILSSGCKFYYRRLQTDLVGEPALNNRADYRGREPKWGPARGGLGREEEEPKRDLAASSVRTACWPTVITIGTVGPTVPKVGMTPPTPPGPNPGREKS